MIRDPSDGSVREKPGLPVSYDDEVSEDQVRQISDIVREEFQSGNWVPVEQDPVLDTSTSGLPITKAKAAYLERLEASRNWLKSYVRPTIEG